MAISQRVNIHAIYQGRGRERQGTILFVPLTQDITLLTAFQDGEWVKYMAQAANATNVPNEGQFAVVLELPQALRRSDTRLDPAVNIAAIREQFSQTIRHHIAHGRAVKVREWYPERRCGFSIEEIASIRPAVDHDVHWQDAKERARNFERPKEENVDVVKHCNLYDFVLKAHDTDVCGNVLDLKNLRPEAPYWVTYVRIQTCTKQWKTHR